MSLPQGFTLESPVKEEVDNTSINDSVISPPGGFVIEEKQDFEWRQDRLADSTMMDKIKTFFGETPEKRIAESQNIYALSDITGLSMEETAKNYELLRRSSQITGFTPEMSNREYMQFAMYPPIIVGAIVNPIGTAAGLLAFSALDKAIPTDKFIESAERRLGIKFKEEIKTTIDIADFVGKALITGGIFKKAPKLAESFLKQKITQYKMPKTVSLSSEQIKDIFQVGDLTTAEQKSLFGSLGLKGSELRNSLEQGVEITIPAEKLITIVDKPFWGKVKGMFGIPTTEKVVSTFAEKPAKAVSGLIEQKPPETAPVGPKEGIVAPTEGKVYYHGGKEVIGEFKGEMGRQGGVYLTTDKKYAQTFAGKEGKITTASFEPKKPYQIIGEENDLLIEAPSSHSIYIQELKDKGYDSIISSDGRQILVFTPDKIKTKLSTPTKVSPQSFKTAEKYVASKGEILYHGTKSEFDVLDPKKTGVSDTGLLGEAVYFTPTKEQAEFFAKDPKSGVGNKPRVIEAYADLKNPIIINDGVLSDGRRLTDLHPRGITKQTSSAINKELKKAGYDGAIFKIGGETTQVAVFDSKNIKTKAQLISEWEAGQKKPPVEPPVTATEPIPEPQNLIAKIKSLQAEKELSNITVSRLKKFIGIENLKKAEIPQLQKLIDYLDKFKKGDALLSEKQLEGLKDIIKELPEPTITPKRVIIDQFGEKTEVLAEGITGKIMNELMPTVDIKEGHPLVERIVNKSDDLLTYAEQEIARRDKQLDLMLTKAEKSRQLPLKEKVKRFLATQNKEIFEAMGGIKVDLTKEEVAVVAYLKNFFKMVRDDLQLEKYRKDYIPHIEQPLMEKIVKKGFFKGIEEIFKKERPLDIPINLLLELDNIIGSEKFFKFALERKGGIKPTTNIRQIIHSYSSLYETKKALDQILPEGQAITKLLLQNRTAQWMKRYLQNLKGRGLDQNFRTGKSAWLAKIADGIVDIGYLKLLGFSWRSPLKNLIAGEANSFIVQDINKYFTGKQRFWANPKRSIELASKYGLLDGMFYDYAQKGIGKIKKLQDLAMAGQQLGEYEIRTSLFMSELTNEEFRTGEIFQDRIRVMKDMIEISQGRFTKTETPLFLQTWYGRMFMQMNRWRITNAMLLNRLAKGTAKEFKEGNFKGKNFKGLGKAFLLYGIGMYFANEARKAGYDAAALIVQSMAENINSVVELVTLRPIIDSISDNPTYSVLKDFAFTIQQAANYFVPALVKEPEKIEFQRGIEETYIAPKRTMEDIINFLDEQ